MGKRIDQIFDSYVMEYKQVDTKNVILASEKVWDYTSQIIDLKQRGELDYLVGELMRESEKQGFQDGFKFVVGLMIECIDPRK